MRTSVGFTSPPSSSSSTSSSSTLHPKNISSSSSHSAWHSPVPYLFGGLAAMLGLIAFALLILACSYWKLSGYLDAEDQENSEIGRSSSGDAAGGKGGDGKGAVGPTVYEERIVVIMAGEEKPTYLATPITSRASLFAHSCSSKSMEGGGDKWKNEKANGTNGELNRQQEEEEEEERQINHPSEQ